MALVGLEVWSTTDQISITSPAGANLDAFMRWRNDKLLKRVQHDNAHLIRCERAQASWPPLPRKWFFFLM